MCRSLFPLSPSVFPLASSRGSYFFFFFFENNHSSPREQPVFSVPVYLLVRDFQFQCLNKTISRRDVTRRECACWFTIDFACCFAFRLYDIFLLDFVLTFLMFFFFFFLEGERGNRKIIILLVTLLNKYIFNNKILIISKRYKSRLTQNFQIKYHCVISEFHCWTELLNNCKYFRIIETVFHIF